ncbi:TIGR03620 family F420-dependent LLM class oxidoreductase [Conexibacter sp. DBS9H8]|uniref:TIGR03620 family F420-dependent LLM class oxidoreductase n=1 Tax=Conexibacter sp. DBS9H8 TaxID=2937801 RepID=UPI00200E4F90|nr:TIGR03620 family F420-dependent LLM class oxidoreductase [Conexibacter sp. DBS9H8]
MELTRYGVWTSLRSLGNDNAAEAAKVAERLGFGVLWLGGSPPLSALRPFLEASAQLTVATSIVNLWAYPEPERLVSEFHALEVDFPGRFLVGLGVGHPEATARYARPLRAMRAFLDAIATAPAPVPPERMILAALGPKMLELSAQRTLGSIPYFTSATHTAFARSHLPGGALLAPELAVVLDRDSERARAAARSYAQLYLGLENYVNNLLRFEFTPEDVRDGGSQRLIDTVVPHGDAAELAARARAHLEAGADHVCLQTVGVSGVPDAEWSAIAGALGLTDRP